MKTKRQYRTEVVLGRKEEGAIIAFLSGKITSRELGAKLQCSHQQAINLISTICRQWFQTGRLKQKVETKTN